VVRAAAEEDEFEARLSKLRKKGSGTGKKAEERKMRKRGPLASQGVARAQPRPRKAPLFELPPVPLKDPMSDGLPVLPASRPTPSA